MVFRGGDSYSLLLVGTFFEQKMRRTSLLLLATLTVLIGCTKDLSVENVSFGELTGIGSEKVTLRVTNVFTKADEANFGWVFKIQEPPASLTLKEVVSGPRGVVWEAPQDATGIEWFDDGRTVALTKVIYKPRPSAHHFFTNWAITASDPIGTYHAKLYVEGKLVGEADFVVSQ